MEHSLKRSHCKRNLVPSRKQATHKLLGTKGGLFGNKGVPRPVPEQHSSYRHRQHHSGYLYKQRRGMKMGPLCALLWRILTWGTSKQVTLKAQHIPDKLSRLGQTIQTVVFPSSVLPGNMQQVAPASNRPLCDKVQQQTSPVLLPVLDSKAWAVNALSLAQEDLDPYAFPPSAILGKVVKLQDHTCRRIILIAPGVAQHALVLGSSGHVQPNTTEPAQPAHTTIQSNFTRESVKPKSTCMAPRASAIKEQGFSEAVAARIETLQGFSITRMLNLWKRTAVVLLFHHGSPKVYSSIMAPNTRIFNPNTRILILNTQRVCSSKAKKHSDKKKHKVRAKYFSQSLSSEENQSSVPNKRSGKPQRPSLLQGRRYI